MGKKDKLIKRLKSRPKDFTFDEAETLLNILTLTIQIRERPVDPELYLKVKIMDALCSINHIHKKSLKLIRSNS